MQASFSTQLKVCPRVTNARLSHNCSTPNEKEEDVLATSGGILCLRSICIHCLIFHCLHWLLQLWLSESFPYCYSTSRSPEVFVYFEKDLTAICSGPIGDCSRRKVGNFFGGLPSWA